jgi:hypothetical protein
MYPCQALDILVDGVADAGSSLISGEPCERRSERSGRVCRHFGSRFSRESLQYASIEMLTAEEVVDVIILCAEWTNQLPRV